MLVKSFNHILKLKVTKPNPPKISDFLTVLKIQGFQKKGRFKKYSTLFSTYLTTLLSKMTVLKVCKGLNCEINRKNITIKAQSHCQT